MWYAALFIVGFVSISYLWVWLLAYVLTGQTPRLRKKEVRNLCALCLCCLALWGLGVMCHR
ncbi:MAG: hypothetical protein HJJLKODD_01669 [Phycisphaerae bacterium]|nr:hypothetical protein [Phycisphaerae bacterium]